jgi:aspartyl-tRNA(Asn)/glutamyl-tRNA(Gln) amidotransferase subunit A
MAIPVKLARLSGLSLPCRFDSQGLPIGLQIIGNVLRENLVVQAAYVYEQTTEWHQQSL